MKIAFVPVRGGSKSIPMKNVKDFCGKPLLYWSLRALQNSNSIDEIIVATDSTKIADIACSFGFSKVRIYNRDPINAQDVSSTESVMLEYISKSTLQMDDVFVLVQATSPFIKSIDIDNACFMFFSDESDSLLSCARIKRFFWNENGTPINYNYTNRPRRQDFDGILVENGAFYISTVGNITKSNNRLSGNISCYEMPEYTSLEIDENDDWVMAEILMKKYYEIENEDHSIKLFLSDVDGTLTDAGMYYSENGDELKKFNTHDGKGFELLRKNGIKTGLITSETTKIVERRASKLKVDYFYQGIEHVGKLDTVKAICAIEGISLSNVAYIGDDINCKDLLMNVGLAGCPADAVDEIKKIHNIIIVSKCGGAGAVREFIDSIISK